MDIMAEALSWWISIIWKMYIYQEIPLIKMRVGALNVGSADTREANRELSPMAMCAPLILGEGPGKLPVEARDCCDVEVMKRKHLLETGRLLKVGYIDLWGS